MFELYTNTHAYTYPHIQWKWITLELFRRIDKIKSYHYHICSEWIFWHLRHSLRNENGDKFKRTDQIRKAFNFIWLPFFPELWHNAGNEHMSITEHFFVSSIYKFACLYANQADFPFILSMMIVHIDFAK